MRKPSVRTRKDDSQDEVDWQSEEEEDDDDDEEEEEMLKSLSFSLPQSSPPQLVPNIDQRKRFFSKLWLLSEDFGGSFLLLATDLK